MSDLSITPVLAGELVRNLREACDYLPVMEFGIGWTAIFYFSLRRRFPLARSSSPPIEVELVASATNDTIPLLVRRASCNDSSFRVIVMLPARASRFIETLPFLAVRAQTRRASERLCTPRIRAGQL